MESKHKNALIGALLAVVFVMAVGYAAFAQTLTITGDATITSVWDVHIKSIELKENGEVGTGHSNSATVSEDRYSATFDVTLLSPGDSVTYVVTVENGGNIDAVVRDSAENPQGVIFSDLAQMNAMANTTNSANGEATDAIVFSYTGINPNDQLLAKKSAEDTTVNTDTFEVTATYNPAITTQPETAQLTKSVTMTLNYKQLGK